MKKYKKEEIGLDDSESICILCGQKFITGIDGNELGFCLCCQDKKSFPYDLDRYYKDYDANKTIFISKR